jgi:glycosyltransferase involved in cell wall biosynthesis
LANKAVAIIAVSENTKNDIIKLYGIDENKITVVYHGNSLFVDDNMNTLINKLPERYILYVGDRWAYKNFDYFVKSVIPILQKDKGLYLVCGGSHPFNKKEIRLLKYYRCENRVLHVCVSDNDTLIGLYKNALAFVFPSLYEGFGIPVLESFSCGCPVVLSNSSSFPEVAGEAGVYFNPEDESSIREAIGSVIYNEEVRADLIKKGYKQLEKFSWEKTALETRRVYESVL